jgi:hypothetical protein
MKKTNWKIGDTYWVYENGEKVYGRIVNILESGIYCVAWSNRITTTLEKMPDPANDWLRIFGESEDE